MALKLIFNPISGKFDYVDVSVSSGAPATPTTMQASLRVSDYTQLLVREPVIVGAGMELYAGQDAAVTQV